MPERERLRIFKVLYVLAIPAVGFLARRAVAVLAAARIGLGDGRWREVGGCWKQKSRRLDHVLTWLDWNYRENAGGSRSRRMRVLVPSPTRPAGIPDAAGGHPRRGRRATFRPVASFISVWIISAKINDLIFFALFFLGFIAFPDLNGEIKGAKKNPALTGVRGRELFLRSQSVTIIRMRASLSPSFLASSALVVNSFAAQRALILSFRSVTFVVPFGRPRPLRGASCSSASDSAANPTVFLARPALVRPSGRARACAIILQMIRDSVPPAPHHHVEGITAQRDKLRVGIRQAGARRGYVNPVSGPNIRAC